jgi:hypothetical protein
MWFMLACSCSTAAAAVQTCRWSLNDHHNNDLAKAQVLSAVWWELQPPYVV